MTLMGPTTVAVSKTDPSNRWDGVFAEHGEVWGGEASPTGKILIDKIEAMRDRLINAGQHRPAISVFEAGYGYGRDLQALLKVKRINAILAGVDSSSVGHTLAVENLRRVAKSTEPWISTGDFTKPLHHTKQDSYDYFLSHRVMHLLGNNGKVRTFIENAYSLLKPGGTAVVSVRDDRDFKPDCMHRRPDGTVVYNDRPDHVITLWKTGELVNTFQRYGFEVQEAVQSQEIESTLHPKESSYFTIIVARKPELVL